MAIFINSKDDKLINLYYVQNIVINPENDKEIIIYNKNGESIIESYDTAEEASTAHDNYVTKMEESSGGGSAKLQTKSVTITENGESVISPDKYFNGMSQVNLNVDVAGGGGSRDWAELGYTGEPQIIDDGFDYAKSIKDNWDDSITTMSTKYKNDSNLFFFPLVDTSNVTSMNGAFDDSNLCFIPLLNTSNVTDMQVAFSKCKGLTSVPLFDTSKVTTMSNMFTNCSGLTSVPLFDTSKVTTMASMFAYCSSLTSVPLFNTSEVKRMDGMFSNCTSLNSIPLFDTSGVTLMTGMVRNCGSLVSFPSFDTGSVTDMSNMCHSCSSLTTVPVLDTSTVTNLGSAFYSCPNLSNESLNNILLMCKNSLYTTKTLKKVGLSSSQATTCQTLSNWSALEAAGWTTGY